MARFATVLWMSWLVSATALAETSEPEPAQLTLPGLIRDVLERNPDLARAAQDVAMWRARVPQAGALPDPTLSSGAINEGRAVPFQTVGDADFSEVYVGITQEIPYPGKRRLREDVAREALGVEQWGYEIARRRLVLEATRTYHDAIATREALAIVERNLALSDQLADVARTRFSVGQGRQQDLLEAEVERSRLEERRSLLEQELRLLEAGVARVLDARTPITATSLARPERAPALEPLADLLTRAEEASPFVEAERARVQWASRKTDLARRDLRPDFGLELAYHDRGRKDLDPFYTFGWTMTLPVYASRKQSRAIEESAAALGSARSGAAAMRAQVRYEVTQAHVQATTAERMLRLYDEGLLPQARLALDSAIAQYEVGKVDFDVVLATWRRLLDDELGHEQHIAAREKAVAALALHLGPTPDAPARAKEN